MIGIVGGGFMGVCLALALSERGMACELLEREADVLTRAGLQSEGKVHLGYVFANDVSGKMADLMALGAAMFEPCLMRWLGTSVRSLAHAAPFQYLVHRSSLVDTEELERRYRRIAARTAEIFGSTPAYFGVDPAMPPERLPRAAFEASYDAGSAQAAFRTGETGLDPEGLAPLLRARVKADPLIRVRTKFNVDAISAADDGVIVSGVESGLPSKARYAQAVNVSWDDQRRLDQSAGALEPGSWLYRYKCFLRTPPDLPLDVPSTTIVLGGFGDVVRYANGAHFLSWYPTGRLGATTAITPLWGNEPDAATQRRVRVETLAGLAALFPGLAKESRSILASEPRVCGGVILAAGESDVDDPHSGLHRRSEPGLRSFGRYHSVNAGKWTCCPRLAVLTADRLASA